MFSCFSSDFWCVPTTPAAGTAGEAAGWASWHRRALLASCGWPTPAQIKAGESTELAGCCWRCGGCFSKLACSKITEAGSLLGKLLARCCVPHFLSSSSLLARLMAPHLPWVEGHQRWVGAAGAGWAVETPRTHVFGEWRVNTVILHYVPARCHTGAADAALHPPCRQPEPGRPRPRAGAGQARAASPAALCGAAPLIKKLLRNL